VVDCAEGTLRQFSLQPGAGEQRYKPLRVRTLLVTHMHGPPVCVCVRALGCGRLTRRTHSRSYHGHHDHAPARPQAALVRPHPGRRAGSWLLFHLVHTAKVDCSRQPRRRSSCTAPRACALSSGTAYLQPARGRRRSTRYTSSSRKATWRRHVRRRTCTGVRRPGVTFARARMASGGSASTLGALCRT
jgi:hypothetical protein